MLQRPTSLWHDALIAARGVCMGAADVVPGVSGGTVALVLGIYERLVTAVSHFDRQLVRLLLRREWRQAAAHVDLRFLVALAAGIAVGFLTMTVAMNYLLTHGGTRSLTMAAFFGMILASAIVVSMWIRSPALATGIGYIGLGLAGAALALAISLMQPTAAEDPSLLYIFICGSIAICAMILPGISGAMMLLILGVYVYLTDIPRMLVRGEEVGHSLAVVLVFGSGCAISLVLFSKVLRWLLTQWRSATMSFLCGLMFGALPKLWPFQIDTTPGIEEWKHKVFQPHWPATWHLEEVSAVAVVIVAMALVLVVDRLVGGSRRGLFTTDSAPRHE
jgi:putative membrane protein